MELTIGGSPLTATVLLQGTAAEVYHERYVTPPGKLSKSRLPVSTFCHMITTREAAEGTYQLPIKLDNVMQQHPHNTTAQKQPSQVPATLDCWLARSAL